MIDLTPSKKAYIRMLKVIIELSTNDDDKSWAESELERLEYLQRWGEE